ncbi:MAG: hypothetical protein KAI09_02070 [Dehalococcoidales bacterium]|jgi:hypothetical protein|nr:hypothetical protein [Dehalococcoidales bacterium]
MYYGFGVYAGASTGQEGFPEPKLGQVLEEPDDRFGIRLDGYAGQVHEARRMII